MAKEEKTTSQIQVRDKQAVAGESTRPGPVFRPDVDILERTDAYVIFADLPGADDKHVDVRLEKGILSLDARLATQPEPDWSPVHVEYRIGDFHREFRISEDVDPGAVSALMRNGVLELTLPKSETHRPRTIAIQAG